MLILGLSAYYHDSAAAIVRDGKILAAAQEERFTRKKNDHSFPSHAVSYCIKASSATWNEVDFVVFYDRPLLKAKRLLNNYLENAPRGYRSFTSALSRWIFDRSQQKSALLRELQKAAPHVDWSQRLLFSEHHLSHAASAFFPSPFPAAAVLVADGVGEWATTSVFHGEGNSLTLQKEILFPHSLGLLYSAFTYYAGFKVNSGEYKLMGLAPYGEPRYADLILSKLIKMNVDGSFQINMQYFDYSTGFTMINDHFSDLFGHPVRGPEDRLDQFHMDIAASIQDVLNQALLSIVHRVASEIGGPNLCLAGGVALNCVANSQILRSGAFKNVWIQPAAGDAGGALGAALAVHYSFCGHSRPIARSACDSMEGGYLGPEFTDAEIQSRLNSLGAVYAVLDDSELFRRCATVLAAGAALGWFQGRMEFGPRALGNRSILADPRPASIQTTLNLKIKKRESFRPFAPSILFEDTSAYFELDGESPYMLLVANIVEKQRVSAGDEDDGLNALRNLKRVRSTIPGVTHVDYSARVQTVRADVNSRYHMLLSTFKEVTGCPLLVNTSFNVRGEPIVCTPEEAFRCFMTTEIEALAIGNCFLAKSLQSPDLPAHLYQEFAPD